MKELASHCGIIFNMISLGYHQTIFQLNMAKTDLFMVILNQKLCVYLAKNRFNSITQQITEKWVDMSTNLWSVLDFSYS